MRITNSLCPGCQGSFYNSAGMVRITCPLCGHSFNVHETMRRRGKRVEFNNDCFILKEGMSMFVRAVNISEKGLGVKIMGAAPFSTGDIIHVTVKDFRISSKARVIWVKKCSTLIFRAGLYFC